MGVARELGMTDEEVLDAMNLEKLYALMKKCNAMCYKCSNNPTHVDCSSLQFLCNAHAVGRTSSCKRIGSERFSSFELQKLQRKFGTSLKGVNNLSIKHLQGSSSRSRRSSKSVSRRRKKSPSSCSETSFNSGSDSDYESRSKHSPKPRRSKSHHRSKSQNNVSSSQPLFASNFEDTGPKQDFNTVSEESQYYPPGMAGILMQKQALQNKFHSLPGDMSNQTTMYPNDFNVYNNNNMPNMGQQNSFPGNQVQHHSYPNNQGQQNSFPGNQVQQNSYTSNQGQQMNHMIPRSNINGMLNQGFQSTTPNDFNMNPLSTLQNPSIPQNQFRDAFQSTPTPTNYHQMNSIVNSLASSNQNGFPQFQQTNSYGPMSQNRAQFMSHNPESNIMNPYQNRKLNPFEPTQYTSSNPTPFASSNSSQPPYTFSNIRPAHQNMMYNNDMIKRQDFFFQNDHFNQPFSNQTYRSNPPTDFFSSTSPRYDNFFSKANSQMESRQMYPSHPTLNPMSMPNDTSFRFQRYDSTPASLSPRIPNVSAHQKDWWD